MQPDNDELYVLLRRLADRNRVRSEATVQADVRQLLLQGDLGLAEQELEVSLEAQVGDRRRIDIEVGFTVIEVKRDLRNPSVVEQAVDQLAGYVAARTDQTGQRYVGVLTDGGTWLAYHLREGALAEVTKHEVKPTRPDPTALLYWLEGVLATRHDVPPTPVEIAQRLGATSASYALDRATLKALYEEYGQRPTVQLKRQLWARLLRSALGTQFTDDEDLFLEHTLLVNSAEIIAHLVVGFDVTERQPATLLNGSSFGQAQIYGVVEHDFFDWVLEVPGGEIFVRTLARRLSRFAWARVDHDVLKVLYESVIGAETRKRLGEYYTPDWLAEQIVAEVVTDPLDQRVLDPACGSGTFLFHAVRRYLAAAEEAGTAVGPALRGLSGRVLGVDLHPVAVTLARVTFLLAIGQQRLQDSSRGPVTIPVYLGDSLQWQQQRLDLFTGGHLVVPTGSGDTLFDADLRFPDHLLADTDQFDHLVNELATLAAKPRKPGAVASLTALLNRLAITADDKPVVRETFALMCRLHDEGRDHIWSYYIRNLARPMYLSRQENRVDVLVGNPPWLAYRHMSAEMQVAFQKMSEARRLWHGNEVATHQDLSGLFVARAVEQYLNVGGDFAFVLPNAALDRAHFAGFRKGHYPDPGEIADVEFRGSWDLRRLRPHFFPRGACVVFGRRAAHPNAKRLPTSTVIWTGRVPRLGEHWLDVGAFITRKTAELVVSDDKSLAGSPYGPRFSQGATIVPRVLFFVQRQEAGPLGWGAGRTAVRSTRSATEKAPWKDLPSLEGTVESEFVKPVLLGESVLPYRVLPPRLAVIPVEGSRLLGGDDPRIDLYPALAEWWRAAEQLWMAHRSSERLTLLEQLDFRRKLTNQRPATWLRVVYGKAGMHVAAALVEDRSAIIDHTLYWATITSREEGMYLCAILNSPALTEVVRPLMSYGKDERHVDKHLWKLPIPLFDPSKPDHHRLAELGNLQADLVAGFDIDESAYFVGLRQRVREALAADQTGAAVAELVEELLAV
jgi:SAM-dependent methyltransferase